MSAPAADAERADAAPTLGTRARPLVEESLAQRTARMRAFLGLVAVAWGTYAVLDLLPGRWWSGTNDVAACVLTLAVRAWARRGDSHGRTTLAAHLGIAVSGTGILCGTLLSGQATSPSLYYLATLPVAAVWLLDARASAGWTAAAIAVIGGVQATSQWWTMEPEFVYVGVELFVSRTILVLIFFGLGYSSWRATALHVAALEAREATIEKQSHQLAAARDEALRASRVKSEFLASMSHEIRTPMNAVIGLTSVLIDTDLADEQRRMLETVRTSGDALLTILNDILDFSKIESGRIDLERQTFDIAACVEDALELLAPAAAEKGLALGCRVEGDARIRVLGDETRLRQILLNLVSNAIKFTHAGEVMVTVSAAPPAGGRREVRIAVRDSGIGIPPDRMDRLFQSFSQVDASTTRRFGGTGLGLAISKRLAERMGGSLQVESSLGIGSTFELTLPLETAKDDEPEANGPSAPSVLPGDAPAQERDRRTRQAAIDAGMAERIPLRILLAEDNTVNQKVATFMLQRMGYRADVVSNGAEAVDAVSRGPYDVILMDIQMPEMDGIEATRIILARSDLPRRPRIIALTANAMADDRDACLAAGMDEFLSKPLTALRLAAALARCGSGTNAT